MKVNITQNILQKGNYSNTALVERIFQSNKQLKIRILEEM